MKQHQFKIYAVAIISLFMVTAGCNKKFEKEITNRDYSDSVSVAYGNPKVLLLIVDGARGISVRDAKTPVLTALLPNSIYSWNSIADEEYPEDGTNWTDLLTGVKSIKHGVLGNNFSDSKFQDYPLIFERIKANQPNTKIVSFASSTVFSEKLNKGVDVSETPGNDEGVKTGIVNTLKNDTASFIVGQFKNIGVAGATSGYDLSKPAYKTAIQNFDTAVGEILGALKNRPDYLNENWLLVVVSNNGEAYEIPVEDDDKTVFSNPKVNTFTIIHNPKYAVRILNKPFLGNKFNGTGIRLSGDINNGVRAVAQNSDLFNFGTKKPFTVEFKLKKNPGPNNNYRWGYPSVISKTAKWSSGETNKGWVIYLQDADWYLRINTRTGSYTIKGGTLSDGNWNSLAFVRLPVGNDTYIMTYTDGKWAGEVVATNWTDFDTDDPLVLGVLPGQGHRELDATISDVRIWATNLPQATISQFACDTEVTENHPYYDYLLGYWPCNEGTGNEFKDYGAAGSDFKLTNNYQWSNFSDLICAPSSSNYGASVPRNVDIATQLLSWLRVPVQQSWKLDGRVWLDQ